MRRAAAWLSGRLERPVAHTWTAGTPRATTRTLLAVVTGAALLTAASGCSDDGQTAASLTVAGYVAPWDPRGAASLDPPPSPLHELSPVWYQPTDDGAVTFASDDAEVQADDLATQGVEGVRLVPSVSNFRDGRWDGELISAILSDPERRDRHIDALVAVARPSGVGGIDIDYEALDAGDRSAYSAFVHDLADALHDMDRKLTVTVHAKTDEPGGWSGAQAQDWQEIGAAADEVRVMAYDNAWADSPPGPIAPLPWVEDVLRFAIEQVSPDRVSLGLPTYGYDWPDGEPGQDLDWADAQEIAESGDVAERWDEDSASPWLTYTDDGGQPHTVWYEDARSLDAKLDLVQQYGVSSVFVWKLGGEDPSIWTVLDDAA